MKSSGQMSPIYKLMTPGPVEVDSSVLERMGSPVLAHFGPEWTAIYNETTHYLKSVFGTSGDVFLLICSGAGGMESAISSLMAPGEKVIIAVNGFFGDRAATIAHFCGLEVLAVTAPWGKVIDPAKVRDLLMRNPDAAALVAVHHETSTGVLNPIADLGKLAKEANVPFIVDAVSSLGGEAFRMDDWGIDICVSASNKCLEAPPGIAPIAVGARAWQIMEEKKNHLLGWYLNLRVWREYADKWADWHPFPVTMATNNVFALHRALELLMTEGIDGRVARYRETARYFRDNVEKLGFQLFVERDIASSAITAVTRLPKMDVSALITFLAQEHRIRIAGGLGETSGQIFRVGHMGKAGSKPSAELLLNAIADYLSLNE